MGTRFRMDKRSSDVCLRDHRNGREGARSRVAASRLDAVALVLLVLEFRSLCSAALVDTSVPCDDRVLPGGSGGGIDCRGGDLGVVRS